MTLVSFCVFLAVSIMDIEFDTLVEDVDASENATLGSPHSALAYFDNEWYLKRSRRARRMDLIGDYAGSEMFVIDGECRSAVSSSNSKGNS